MNTKAIRECAASHVYWTERAKETPSALIRWTIPGLCDRVDELEDRLRAVEAALREGEGGMVEVGRIRAALYVAADQSLDVSTIEKGQAIWAALASATSPAEEAS